MLKRAIAVVLSGMIAFGMYTAYAEETVSLDTEQTVSTPAEESELVINSDDIEFSTVQSEEADETDITAFSDVEAAVIDDDNFTDELEDNTHMYECVNFKPYSEISPSNAPLFEDKTLMSFAINNTEAYIIYKVAETRSFKSLYVENYIRDGGKNADVLVSSDGIEYTSLNPQWNKLGSGGDGANDAGWSDRNAYQENFSKEDNVRFIKIYKTGESYATKYKIGHVTVATYDLSKGDEPGESDENPVIDEDSFEDELEDNTHMYECVNFKPYSEISPSNAPLFNDKTLMSFAINNTEAYIIYKVAETRSFKSLYVENYIRDGGKNADVLVSSDGIEYTSLNPQWNKLCSGGDGANDAGWSDRNAYTANFSEDNNVRFIKIYKTGESYATKYKIGKVTLETYDMARGNVPAGSYEEEFESDYHINELKDASLDSENRRIVAEKADSVVIYKALPQKSLKTVELVTVGEWKGSVEVLDINKRTSEITVEPTVEETDGGKRVTVSLPNDAAYVKLVGMAVYSKIVIESDSAVGHEWTFKDGAVEFTPDTLQSNSTVSFKLPVKNKGSEKQSLKAFVCLYEGDRMDKIEEFPAVVDGGREINIKGEVTLNTVTEKTCVRVFVWSDIGTMISFGDESVLGTE